MASARFKSRRSPGPSEETAKVVEAVWAYYEAGRRPPTTRIAPSDEPAAAPPADEPEAVSHHTANAVEEAIVTADGQSHEELADELEALIESIRYGTTEPPGDAA